MLNIPGFSNSTSGLESIIQQYMALERRPLNRLQSQKSALSTKASLFDAVKQQLDSLKDLAEDLANTDSDSIFNTTSATSSDSDLITVSASDDAGMGTYVFRVRQLATSTTMKSSAELNTAVSIKSSSQVVAGLDGLDTTKSWSEAGFDTTPTGTVSFDSGSGWVTFTLSDYSTIDDFLDAVNADTTAAVNIYYDSDQDKFVIEKDATGGTLTIKQSTTDGFLTQANIATDTADHIISSNTTGVRTDVYLYKSNFDNAVAETDSGSFKINGVTFSWDADQDTLDDIISDINSSEANVTAFYDETLDKLTITSNSTGSEEIQYEDVSGTFLSSTLKLASVTQSLGQDAKFTINSTDSADEITKSSNTFTLNGLEITLKAVTVANSDYTDTNTEAVTITATRDIDSIESKIKSFLTTFNSVADYLKTQTNVDPTTYKRGALADESTFRSLRSTLFSYMINVVSSVDSGDPATLGEIGITFDSSLQASVTDSSTLRSLLTSNPSGVAALFNSTNGIATRIYSLLDTYTEDDGIIDGRKDIIQDHIDFYDDQIKVMKERLEVKESQYRSQITKMQDLLIQTVQQQQLVSNILAMSQQMVGL